MTQKIKLFCIIGESGCGKTHALRILEEGYGVNVIHTHTTRPIRENDDKIAGTREEHAIEKKNKTAIAETEFDDNLYWTSLNDIDPTHNFQAVILDKKGIQDIKDDDRFDAVVIRVYTPEQLRVSRMIAQGRNADVIKKRVAHDEIAFRDIISDYSVTNVGPAIDTAVSILKIMKGTLQ